MIYQEINNREPVGNSCTVTDRMNVPDGLSEQWNRLTDVLHVACLAEPCVKGSREVVK